MFFFERRGRHPRNWSLWTQDRLDRFIVDLRLTNSLLWFIQELFQVALAPAVVGSVAATPWGLTHHNVVFKIKCLFVFWYLLCLFFDRFTCIWIGVILDFGQFSIYKLVAKRGLVEPFYRATRVVCFGVPLHFWLEFSFSTWHWKELCKLVDLVRRLCWRSEETAFASGWTNDVSGVLVNLNHKFWWHNVHILTRRRRGRAIAVAFFLGYTLITPIQKFVVNVLKALFQARRHSLYFFHILLE